MIDPAMQPHVRPVSDRDLSRFLGYVQPTRQEIHAQHPVCGLFVSIIKGADLSVTMPTARCGQPMDCVDGSGCPSGSLN